MDRKEDKAKTARGALLGYALMIENAKNTPFYSSLNAKDLQRAFATISTLKRKLENLVNALDADSINAHQVEKVTRGKGAEEENSDEEAVGTTISNIIAALNQPTETARRYLSMLGECSSIMQNLLKDGASSVYHADFLVRTINELLGPKSAFCQALNQGKSNTPEEKESFNNACQVAFSIGEAIKNQPYVKLRSLVSDMFGTGAVREFDGYPQSERSAYTKSYDLNTEDGLKGFVNHVGQQGSNKINQFIMDYSDGMAQALREVFEQIKTDKIKTKGLQEAIAFLNAYSESDCKTAKEIKDQVAKKESDFRRTAKNTTNAKLKGGNFLPVAGVGQVLNPLRYQNGSRSKDLGKLQEVMKNAYVVYRGWQDLQDKLLTSARMLCGFARNRISSVLDKHGGASWFRPAMEKVSFNNIETDPKYNAIINGSLEELLKAYFAIETESSKMQALPIVLLSKNDEIVKKIQERTKAEDVVVDELKEIIRNIVKKDLVGEVALALKDASIPISDFHKIKGAENETPSKIATSHLLKFCKVLYQNKEKGRFDENLRVLLQNKIKESPDFSTLALRVGEMCGFVPSNIGKIKNGQQYTPKDAQSAYQEVVEELSRENNTEALNTVLALFEDYKPWAASYAREVSKQIEKRKKYEIERAIGWQETLRNVCAFLCDSNQYKNAVSKSALTANVLVSSLLADAILKDAGYRDQKKIGADLGGIARRLWDKAEEKPIQPSPAEDVAIELFLEPLIRREYEIAVSKAESVLTKDAFDKVEAQKGSAISFISNGAFIDFDEEVVMQSLGKIKEYVALKEGARGNLPLEEYAFSQIKATATDLWFPENKYAQVEIREGSFSAERQKELLEKVWESVKEQRVKESFELLEEVEQNNPFFCLVGRGRSYTVSGIKEQILKGNANLEDMLKESRWASVDAQFSERMGGTSDIVKLKMSQRFLDEKKAEIEQARDATKRFEHVEVGDKRALVVELLPSVCKVFCPEVGYLVGKDITDGEQALRIGLQVSRSKEVVERGVFAEARNDFMPILAEYVSTVQGKGEYAVGFQAHVPGVVYLDKYGQYKAVGEEKASSYEPNVLMPLSESKAKPEGEFVALLNKAGYKEFLKTSETYSQVVQKELFGKTKKGEADVSKVKAGIVAARQSAEYTKKIEASSPVKTYAQSLAKTIMDS